MPTLGQIEDAFTKSGPPTAEAQSNQLSLDPAADWLAERINPAAQRRNSYERPKDLLRDYLGPAYEDRAHIDAMDEAFVALSQRQIHGLVVNIHPQSGKTTFSSIVFPAWYLGQHPSHPVVLTSYGTKHIQEQSRKCREIVRARSLDLGLTLLKGKQSSEWWGLEQGGGVWAGGLNGGITGKSAELLLCDDPIKNWQQAHSAVYKRLNIANWRTGCESRLRSGGVRCVVMTRWTPDDLTAWIKENDAEGYEILNLPALCISVPGDPVGRKSVGEPLAPATREEFDRKKQAVGQYNFDAMWQGIPHRHPPEHEGIISYQQCVDAANRRVDIHKVNGQEKPAGYWLNLPEDLGADIARSPNGDRLTYATVKGTRLTSLEVKQGQSLMQTANQLRRIIVRRKIRSARIDDTGMGGGVTDRLLEMQEDPDAEPEFKACEIVGVNFANKAHDSEHWANIRTEMWMIVADDLKEGKADLPWNDELFDDLIAPQLLLTPGGARRLESSESLKRRGVRSPDLAWAYALARYPDEYFDRVQSW